MPDFLLEAVLRVFRAEREERPRVMGESVGVSGVQAKVTLT